MLYDDVCAAKERLSRTSNADINLPTLEVDAHLTRDELEGLIRGYLGSTVACLHRTIENSRLRPAEWLRLRITRRKALYKHHSSSRKEPLIPFVRAMEKALSVRSTSSEASPS